MKVDIKIVIKWFPLWWNPKIFNAEIIRNESVRLFGLFPLGKRHTRTRDESIKPELQ